jgi:hypothetical protein
VTPIGFFSFRRRKKEKKRKEKKRKEKKRKEKKRKEKKEKKRRKAGSFYMGVYLVVTVYY